MASSQRFSILDRPIFTVHASQPLIPDSESASKPHATANCYPPPAACGSHLYRPRTSVTATGISISVHKRRAVDLHPAGVFLVFQRYGYKRHHPTEGTLAHFPQSPCTSHPPNGGCSLLARLSPAASSSPSTTLPSLVRLSPAVAVASRPQPRR
jgi:hypothetical protein